jgi:hypothetical protein
MVEKNAKNVLPQMIFDFFVSHFINILNFIFITCKFLSGKMTQIL